MFNKKKREKTLPYEQSVMIDTFGHLAPEKNKTYRGTMLIAKSAFKEREAEIIDFKFDNDLESSPWLFEVLERYVKNFRIKEGHVHEINIKIKNFKVKWHKFVKEIKID